MRKNLDLDMFSWTITAGFVASLFLAPNASMTVVLLGILAFTKVIACELRKQNK